LVAAQVDPVSGQPETKATPATIEAVRLPYRGFLLTRGRAFLPDGAVWTRVTLPGAIGYLLASTEPPEAWRQHAAALLSCGETAEYVDECGGTYRAATFRDGRLYASLFIGPTEAEPQWGAVAALFEQEVLEPAQRRAVLSGKPVDGAADPGAPVCACFGVGLTAIRSAVAAGARTYVDVQKLLGAGTSCGSCIPELRKICRAEAGCGN
jgi:assimilatory nitrate reductase catalytic subunit